MITQAQITSSNAGVCTGIQLRLMSPTPHFFSLLRLRCMPHTQLLHPIKTEVLLWRISVLWVMEIPAAWCSNELHVPSGFRRRWMWSC